MKSLIGFLIIILSSMHNVYSEGQNKLRPAEQTSIKVPHHPLNTGRLAMSAFMLTGNDQSDETWSASLHEMRNMGIQVVEIGQIAWHKIEKKPQQYDWGYAERVLAINQSEKLGLEFVMDLMFINPDLNGKHRLPAYLMQYKFNDPKVIYALSNLYEEFFKLAGSDSVKWLFQHFENADSVVGKSKEDILEIQELLRSSFAHVKTIRPDIRTGVCIQKYEGDTHWPASEIKQWNLEVGTDIVPVISFRPDHFNKNGRGITEAFDAIAQAAQGRPVALNETGFHSSPTAGSSDDDQIKFVRDLFSLLQSRRDKIEFATWFEYRDLKPVTAKIVGTLVALGTGNAKLRTYLIGYLGSSGLFSHDGQPKPALNTWIKEASRYYK